MKKMSIPNSENLKKAAGIVMAVGAAFMAFSNTITDQKKEREFEDMKKAIAELRNK